MVLYMPFSHHHYHHNHHHILIIIMHHHLCSSSGQQRQLVELLSDPCNKPGICDGFKHSNSLCRSYADKKVEVNVAPIARHLWAPLFQRSYSCGCDNFYAWDLKKRKCVDGSYIWTTIITSPLKSILVQFETT